MIPTFEELCSRSSVWEYFRQISEIPRESGNETGVRDYLKQFAAAHALPVNEDAVGNIIITCPATPGMEQVPPTALQGHMDMVCVKAPGSLHDFAKDPIRPKTILADDGEVWVAAEETTLGADNGIALAMMLALFTEAEISHGPLEGVCTISEETGLDGAFGLDIGLVRSRRLINLDSEEEGTFYIGCAGGSEVFGTLEAAWEPVPAESEVWSLRLSGFQGGHSGGEIHTERGNAIQWGARILRAIYTKVPLSLCAIAGGTKRNVIPSDLTVTFVTPKSAHDLVRTTAAYHQEAMKVELAAKDPGAVLTLDPAPAPVPQRVISPSQSRSVLDAVYMTPHGIQTMSSEIPGLVETSTNMAVLRLEEDRFIIITSQRSSIMSARDAMIDKNLATLSCCGAELAVVNEYPSWRPDPDSPFARLCAASYQHFTGMEPNVTAIHAGLECGVLNSKAPDMLSISFGPTITGAHSTEERVQVASLDRIYGFLRHLIGELSLPV